MTAPELRFDADACLYLLAFLAGVARFGAMSLTANKSLQTLSSKSLNEVMNVHEVWTGNLAGTQSWRAVSPATPYSLPGSEQGAI